MRVLILSQWFQPEPMFKGMPLVRELMKLGHEVEVITGYPWYPGGELYPGWKMRRVETCEMDGVTVHRTWEYPSHDRSAVRRALSYAIFGATARWFGVPRVKRPDVVYAYNLPSLAPACRELKRRHRCAIVLDIQDLWPEAVTSSGMLRVPGLGVAVKAYSNRAYNMADAIVCNSEGYRDMLVERGHAPETLEVIYNWSPVEEPALARSAEVMRALGIPEGRFVVMYAGSMGRAQGLQVAIEAARICVVAGAPITFVLLGKGTEVELLKASAASLPTGSVVFPDQQPLDRMPAVNGCADAMLVHLRKMPGLDLTIPSKTQACLASGRPVLIGVAGEANRLVEQAEAGLSFESDNAEDLARAAMKLAAMSEADRIEMGRRGRAFYEGRLARSIGAKRLADLFKRTHEQVSDATANAPRG
jgi:glycosyltransferase involved in cell wall biosynthesis